MEAGKWQCRLLNRMMEERGLKALVLSCLSKEGVVFPPGCSYGAAPRGRLWIVCQSREKVRLLAAFLYAAGGGRKGRQNSVFDPNRTFVFYL